MDYNEDQKKSFMNRCLELAKSGKGNTLSNPMVGSVIVRKGIIIGEGYHRKFGEKHAEVNAIESVKDPEMLKDSTLFVNLEPCSHYGKTPPCSDLIIEKGIPRVIIGTIDTSSQVAGKGIEKMKSAGIKVESGVLEKSCRFLNRRFFTFHEKKRPYIVLKWAQSADSFLDVVRKKNSPVGPNWISGPYERILVHKWRAEEETILVGTRTAKIDNPRLTLRDWAGHQPLRIVIDRKLKLNHSLHLFDKSIPTLIITEKTIPKEENFEPLILKEGIPFWSQVLEFLFKKEISSVMVEGGQFTINSLLDIGLWDEIRIFTGEQFFHEGVKAPLKPDGSGQKWQLWKAELENIFFSLKIS